MRISLRIPSRRVSYLRRAYAIHKVSILIMIEARDIRIDMVLTMCCMSCWIMRYLECTVLGCPSYTGIPDTARQVSFSVATIVLQVIVQMMIQKERRVKLI